jgi:hypothetical protein
LNNHKMILLDEWFSINQTVPSDNSEVCLIRYRDWFAHSRQKANLFPQDLVIVVMKSQKNRQIIVDEFVTKRPNQPAKVIFLEEEEEQEQGEEEEQGHKQE